jgi:hypothetical protein
VSVTHREACVATTPIINPRKKSLLPSAIVQIMSRLPFNMSLASAISMWLLMTYVLIASASLSGRTVLLYARQPPIQLQVREHREHYQDTFLQSNVHMTSPTSLLAAASVAPSYQTIDNETLFELLNQPATRINTTQLTDSLGDLDLARGFEESGETPTEEQQYNDTSNDLVEEKCPSGIETLDCEDCGGPERTWETRRGDYHCIGVSGSATHGYMQLMCSLDRNRKLQMEELFLPQLERSRQFSSSLHVRLGFGG